MKTTKPIFPRLPKSCTSDRLLLRAIEDSDAEDYHAIRTDIELMKWTSTAECDVDIEATRVWMARIRAPFETLLYSIEERTCPGTVIGWIGVHCYSPLELGYIFARKFWGKGYATEAVQAFLHAYWALERKIFEVEKEEHENERLHAVTDVDNEASRRVLEKCGFTLASECESHGRGHASYYFERPSDWTFG